MRGYDGDEFAGSNYFGLSPKLWEVPLVASYQVIGAGSVGALKKLVIVGIHCNFERMHRDNELCMILYELEELLAKPPAELEFGAGKHCATFRENGFGDVELGRFGD